MSIPAEERILEKDLYEIWSRSQFEDEIFTVDGDKIEILNSGELNSNEAGPDFKNARIRIGNITYVGDIEIDVSYSDWKRHGHHVNKRFNKVILHTALISDKRNQFVYTQSGRKIHSININNLLKEKIDSSNLNIKHDNENCKISCKTLIHLIGEDDKIAVLSKLGLEKFKRKVEVLSHRLRELLYLSELDVQEPVIKYEIPKEYYDKKFSYEELSNKNIWEQMFYECVFEALGYSQNKSIMLKLAKSVDLAFLRKFNNGNERIINFESALLHVSGIIPKEYTELDGDTSEYIRKIYDKWEDIKNSYTGKTYKPEDWHFYRLRPQNFPTIRIAGGARVINLILNEDLIPNIIKKFTEIVNPGVLSKSVRYLFSVRSDGYWSTHFMINKVSKERIHHFVGINRSDEIFLNVILPFIYLYFKIFNKEQLAQKTLNVYSQIELDLENNIVKEISNCLNMDHGWKRSIIYQGMLELFRNYCSNENCSECDFGRMIFEEN